MKPAQFSYTAYGLQLFSNRPLPLLIPDGGKPANLPAFEIEFLDGVGTGRSDPAGEALLYTTDILNENGDPALKIWKGNGTGEYFIRYFNGLTFCIDSAVSRLQVCSAQQTNQADTCSFLLGPVMGIVLRMKGIVCLHASAVEIQGKAVAFTGPMGAGKSTAAAIFAQRGHPVLADDIVALERSEAPFAVRPAYPYLNLLPDSLALVFGAGAGAKSADPEGEKVQVVLDGKSLRFHDRPLPMGAIYILEEGNEQSLPAITSIRPQEAIIALASQTYANKMLDRPMRAHEFQVLGELTKAVPVRRLVVPSRDSKIRDLYDALSRDAAAALQSRLKNCPA